MLLTEEQLQEIRQIIQDHHNAFVANAIAPEAVAPDILERLKQKGIYAPKIESIREAYLYGQVLAALDDPKVASMSYEDLKRHLKTNPVPLTNIERQAITMAQQQAGQYAVGLGNRIDQQTGQLLIEADHVLRQRLRDEIKTATAENIERRESVKQLKSDLGWATKDWARDWDRIAVTEKHNAMQHGVADHYAERYGTEARVAKRPMPDACPHCRRLHLGPDGMPRIFRLSELVGNGTNFRTKAADWKPTIGPVHPHCQCQLIRVPEGWGFDETGRLVPGGTYGVESEDLEASLRFEDELLKAEQTHGTIRFQNLVIRVENPKGSVRQWTDQQGRKGKTTMLWPYGFIEGTEGQDGEEVDCFVGPDPKATHAYIVHQQNPKSGQYDETKCFLGFQSVAQVERVYRQHYDRPDFRVWTDELEVEAFKRWLQGFQKSEPPRAERFVLRKAGLSGTGISPLGNSPGVTEGSRGPVQGTASNYLVGTPRVKPKSDPKALTPDVRELFDLDADNAKIPEAGKRDLDIYTFNEFPERIVRRFDLPEEWGQQFQKLWDEADENRAHVDREYQRVAPVSRNTVDPNASFQKSVDGKLPSWQSKTPGGLVMTLPADKFEGLEKAGGPYIGPRGGKWADPEHTIPWKEPTARAHEPEGFEAPTERYDDDKAFDALMRAGELLYLHQKWDPLTQDNTGFNRNDMNAWPSIAGGAHKGDKGSLRRLRGILVKYKRQIGAAEWYRLGLGDAAAEKAEGIKVHPEYQGGNLMLPVGGRIGRDNWNNYLDIQRAYKAKGLAFNGTTWYVRAEQVATFPWAEYQAKMQGIGIGFGEMPELPSAKPEVPETKKPLSVKDVIEQIQNREAVDTIAVSVIQEGPHAGKFAFWSTYSPEFNNIFSNKSGILTGITEYAKELGHARLTNDPHLVEEALQKIREKLPNHTIVIGQSVREKQQAIGESLTTKQKPIPAVQEKVAPGVTLFPFQNEGVRFFMETDGNALLGDEMGLGKTMQTLAYAAATGKRTLVVCPKVVRKNWLNEATRFFPGHFHGMELRTQDLRKHGMPDLTKVSIATVNYENLEKFMPAIQAAGFDLLVVDESHRIKNPKAKMTKNVQKIAAGVKHKILLSGTAIKNRREELFTQLQIVKPGMFGSASELKFSTIGATFHKLSSVYLARAKKSVLKDLPPKTTAIVNHEIDLEDLPPMPRDIGEISRAKAELALAKVPTTVSFVEELLESSDSNVLVFTDSVQAAEEITQKLGPVAVVHHGGTSDTKRAEAVGHFDPKTRQEGDSVRVFVATAGSAGIGINLQTADKVVFNDLPWTPADLRQAEDRAYRIGTKTPVNVYWMTVDGHEFDQLIADTIKRKYELTRKSLEGKQLTKEEREWMEKPLSPTEILAKIKGEPVGPTETSDREVGKTPEIEVEAPKTQEPTAPEVTVEAKTPPPPKPAEDLPRHFIEEPLPRYGLVKWIESFHDRAKHETWPDGAKTMNLKFQTPLRTGDVPALRKQLKAAGFEERAPKSWSRQQGHIFQNVSYGDYGARLTVDYQWEDHSGIKPPEGGAEQLKLFEKSGAAIDLDGPHDFQR